MRGSGASSAYDGLNVRLQLQNLHRTGLSLAGNYTWSHALDELSSTFGDSLQGGSGYIGSLGYTSLADPHLDWGSADYDVRQRLTVAPIWQTPWFKQGNGIERQALAAGRFPAFTRLEAESRSRSSTTARTRPSTLCRAWSPQRPSTPRRSASKPQMLGANQFQRLEYPASEEFHAPQQHAGYLRLRSVPKRHDAPQLHPRSGRMERRRIAPQDLPNHRTCGNGVRR
jgi:hypothetical protein